MLLVDGKIPMRWWDRAPNFGDLLGPWLAQRMTGFEVFEARPDQPHYMTIGSILSRVTPASVAWGLGSFGNEARRHVPAKTRFLAARGPLTRARIEMFGGTCPRVYGDPGILVADYYRPQVAQQYELGVVLRWSERQRLDNFSVEGVRLIDLQTTQVEETIDAMLSCRRILTTSLHGLILADAYNLPNAWLIADTGEGKEHKFWDYLLAAGKVRDPAECDITADHVDLRFLLDHFRYDDRPSRIDLDALRAACPMLHRTPAIEAAEAAAVAGARALARAARKAAA